MIENLFTSLSTAMSQSVWLAAIAAFVWGLLSILLSPCHLAAIPLLIGFITGQANAGARRVFSLSLTFAFGILITIAAIGLVTAMLGRLLGDVGFLGNLLVAAVFVLIGLHLMDVIPLSWSGFQTGGTRASGLTAALVLGLLFGIGLGPCTFAFMAPVLGVVFQTATTNLATAIILLFAFAVGHCTVIVLAGVLAGRIGGYLHWTEQSGAVRWVRRVCGALVVLGGIYLIWRLF